MRPTHETTRHGTAQLSHSKALQGTHETTRHGTAQLSHNKALQGLTKFNTRLLLL
jgi:hypothetical protein